MDFIKKFNEPRNKIKVQKRTITSMKIVKIKLLI